MISLVQTLASVSTLNPCRRALIWPCKHSETVVRMEWLSDSVPTPWAGKPGERSLSGPQSRCVQPGRLVEAGTSEGKVADRCKVISHKSRPQTPSSFHSFLHVSSCFFLFLQEKRSARPCRKEFLKLFTEPRLDRSQICFYFH